MNRDRNDHDNEGAPWWRHGMVWLVIGGPAAVVVAGFATLAIAIAYPDPVLSTTSVDATHAPAVQARNHVSESPKLAPISPPEGNAGRLGRPVAGRTATQ